MGIPVVGGEKVAKTLEVGEEGAQGREQEEEEGMKVEWEEEGREEGIGEEAKT